MIIFIFTVSKALAAETDTIYEIKFFDSRLSVKTGIGFILDKKEADKIISVKFQSLPIESALKRTLDKLDHAVIFNFDGKACKVIICGKNKISLTSHVHEGNILLSFEHFVLCPLFAP